MARPKKAPNEVAGLTLTIRLTTEERKLLDRLVEARSEELAESGATVSAASLIRGLVRKEARTKGFLGDNARRVRKSGRT